MTTCKNLCLSKNCQQKVTNYANFSRYHAVCDAHIALVDQSETPIFCSNCKIEIKCIKNLPLRNKKNYKQSLKNSSQPLIPENVTLSSIRMQPRSDLRSRNLTPGLSESKCTWPKCNSRKNTRKACETHYFCELHFEKQDFCPLCKCKSCNRFRVNVKRCGDKSCDTCIKKSNCCQECCKKMNNNILMHKCKHFMCENCFDKRKCCVCKVCQICENFESCDRNCSHLVCKGCELNLKCPICMTGTCENCKLQKPLEAFKCQKHSFCIDCQNNLSRCPMCSSICIRCNKNDSSPDPQCTSHPLCEECSKEFKKGFCVYCDDLRRFTCDSCKKTFDTFEKIKCSHQVCLNCSTLECEHQGCPVCLEQYKICVLCEPTAFCCGCKKVRKGEKFSCSHGFCSKCGIINKDEHYFCTVCDSQDYFKNGICLKCSGSVCGICHKIEELPTHQCGHKICNECFEENLICLLCLTDAECAYCGKQKQSFYQSCQTHSCCLECYKKVKTKDCLFCKGVSDDYRCSFCLFYYEMIETLNCLHKVCNGCQIVNIEKCELCIMCSVCQKVSTKASLNCDHEICQVCQNQSNDENCAVCNQTFIYCKICKSHQKSKICKENHIICSECCLFLKKKYQSECFQCYSFCFYCREYKESYLLDCRHSVCATCDEMNEKSQCACLICDKSNSCNFCSKVYSDDQFIPLTCQHKLCIGCKDKGPIKKCKKCKPRHFCIECGKCDQYKRISCGHFLCKECGIKKKDEDYFCDKCDNNENFYTGKCEVCSKRFKRYCKKCTFPEKFKCKHQLCIECMKKDEGCEFCFQELSCYFCKSKAKYYSNFCENHSICKTCQLCINRDDCIICLKLENEYLCNFCSSNTEKSTSLPCGCKACSSCLSNQKAFCTWSIKCDICGCTSHSATFENCTHKICHSCNISTNQDSCCICNSTFCINKCSFCLNFKKVEILECLHLICIECKENIDFDGQNCLKCLETGKNQCLKCSKIQKSDNLKTLSCGHQFCITCEPADRCDLCEYSICLGCEKEFTAKNVDKICEHQLCETCQHLGCRFCLQKQVNEKFKIKVQRNLEILNESESKLQSFLSEMRKKRKIIEREKLLHEQISSENFRFNPDDSKHQEILKNKLKLQDDELYILMESLMSVNFIDYEEEINCYGGESTIFK